MQTMTVITNVYGDTAQQVVMPASWRSEYQRYLEARCDAHVQAWLTGYHFNTNKEQAA